MRMTDLARQVVSELFQAYNSDPSQMRAEFAQRSDTQRAISDYIAGMTDRFAQREHERLTGHKLW
jgi:dGTPase